MSLSIVFSTRKRNEEFINHLRKTSGVEDMEILCYENNGEFSLTEIYNRGLLESTNYHVVFLHDDVSFESGSKWGIKVNEHFKQFPQYGILGKAGTVHLPHTAQWWALPQFMLGRVFHESNHPQTGKKMKWLSEYSGNYGNMITPTVVVDGLFFAVRKDIIQESFDENIKGFHMYEIDFCVANFLKGVKIGVIYNFEIIHKSVGETNEQWEENRKIVAEKYKENLPLQSEIILVKNEQEVKIKKQPWVSVVICTKGNVALLSGLIESIHEKVKYKNYEIIIADTGSTPEEKDQMWKYVLDPHPDTVSLVEYDYYNFAKINNDVVKNCSHKDDELILFCNNDIVFENDCISRMVQTYLDNRHTCGTVGARLHFPDNKVQHAGVFVMKSKATNKPAVGHIGYGTAYKFQTKTYTVAGNTAALMLMKKSIFEKLGGFPEKYNECFEDVQLNFECLLRGMTNYLCGDAVAYHLESQTRGKETTPTALKDYEVLQEYINSNITKLAKYFVQE